MIVHGNQATLFGQCTFLPFPTASLLSLVCSHLTRTLLHVVRPLKHGISSCFSHWGKLSTEDPACCLLPLIIWSMEITQAFENTFQKHSLPLQQESGTFVKGKTCHHLQKKGLHRNETNSDLWFCSKSAAFLTFRSQQRWKTPGQPLYSLGEKSKKTW